MCSSDLFGRGLRRVKGKVLSVVDYIGNHRAFLSKVQSLLPAIFDVGDSPESLRRALQALLEERLQLPADCGVTYELEAIEILEQLLRPTSRASELQAAYEAFREQHGQRPTARELAIQGTLTRASIKPFGSWFELVRDMRDLKYEEQEQLERDQGLLTTIEQSRMERSYKMVALLAMMEEAAFPGSIEIQRLATRFLVIAERFPVLRDELRDTLGEQGGSLTSMLKSNPLRAWAGTKRGSGSAFFSLEGEEFAATPALVDSVADTGASEVLASMCRELVEWRLADYIDRHAPQRVECPVVLKETGAPLVGLERSSHRGLPEGQESILVNGRSFIGYFGADALTSLQEAGMEPAEDQLPKILEGWFAGALSASPMGCTVILDLTQDPIRLLPGVGHRSQGAEIGAKYMRADIPPIFGLEFSRSKWNQGMVTTGSGMVLLVTLNKKGKLDAHQYDDKFLSRTEFQWQSQNQTRQEGKQGRILRGQEDSGRQIHLFVRKDGKLASGTAAPFTYCGRLDFLRWEGERPITVWWRLNEPLPPRVQSEFGVL